MGHIYLVGMMGSGKSSVAQLLAQQLARPAIDLDQEIVTREGMSINQIFQERGETYFRGVETKVLKTCAAQTDAVIATGGGIVLLDENFAIMRATGTVFYLAAPIDELFEHVRGDTTRPLLKQADPKQALRDIFAAREARYKQADHIINTAGMRPRGIADAIMSVVKGSS